MTIDLINHKVSEHQALTFDDVLMTPHFTEVKRQDVSLAITLHPKIKLNLPVISSPMDTVTEAAMAETMAQAGGLGIIHRNMSPIDQARMVKHIKQTTVTDPALAAVDERGRLLVGAAIGAGEDVLARATALVEAEVDIIVIDSSHGYSNFIAGIVKMVKEKYPHLPIMAGNVATAEAARFLVDAGADVIRVGIGPGSICTTRIVTGVGVPQLTAIAESVKGVIGTQATVVADGGIKQMGDMAKCLGFGATAVMLGSMLSGYDQSPGDIISVGDKQYKSYRGMGSIAAMQKGGALRYGQARDTEVKKLVPEGVEGLVKYKGCVLDFLYQVAGSLRSAYYYVGAQNGSEMAEKATFVRITAAGMIESHPHEISITNTGANYNL